MSVPPALESGYQLWYYYPSFAGNIAFAALFGLLSIVHLIGLCLNRLKICIPLVIGGVFEIIGYAARAYCHSHSDSVPLYAVQSIMILLAPILFAASVYMYLGRLMIATNTQELSPIPMKWLTKIFVTSDVVCFFIQAIGGGMQSVKKLQDTPEIAENVILTGLILQIVIFLVFLVEVMIQHRRMTRTRMAETKVAWKRLLYALYIVSGLICLRNIFRAIEYGMGADAYLLTHEWTGFVFDGVLMLIALIVCVTWYIGGGAKLNPRYDGYANTEEMKPVQPARRR